MVDSNTNRTVFREELQESITSVKAGTTSFKDHGFRYTVQEGSVRNGTLNMTAQVSLETYIESDSKRYEEEGFVHCNPVSAVLSFRKENDVTLEKEIIVTMEHHCFVQNYEELIFYLLVSTSDGELIFRESRKGNFSRDDNGRQVGSVLLSDSDFTKYKNPHFMIVRRGMSETKCKE